MTWSNLTSLISARLQWNAGHAATWTRAGKTNLPPDALVAEIYIQKTSHTTKTRTLHRYFIFCFLLSKRTTQQNLRRVAGRLAQWLLPNACQCKECVSGLSLVYKRSCPEWLYSKKHREQRANKIVPRRLHARRHPTTTTRSSQKTNKNF